MRRRRRWREDGRQKDFLFRVGPLAPRPVRPEAHRSPWGLGHPTAPNSAAGAQRRIDGERMDRLWCKAPSSKPRGRPAAAPKRGPAVARRRATRYGVARKPGELEPRNRYGAVRCRASNTELGVADRPPIAEEAERGQAWGSRTEEAVAGGHSDEVRRCQAQPQPAAKSQRPRMRRGGRGAPRTLWPEVTATRQRRRDPRRRPAATTDICGRCPWPRAASRDRARRSVW